MSFEVFSKIKKNPEVENFRNLTAENLIIKGTFTLPTSFIAGTGATGATGPIGPSGKDFHVEYVVNDVMNLPLSASEGEFAFINSSDDDVHNSKFYRYTGGIWVFDHDFSGIAGSTGPQGSQGPAGIMGNTGIQGLVGPQGPQGPVGNTGPQGVTGPTGPSINLSSVNDLSLSGSSVNNIIVWDGSQWTESSTVNVNGRTGPTGSTGATGLTGIDGVVGHTGAIGITGPDGINGTDGVTGPAGIDGTDGATGATGLIGSDGNVGVVGDVGSTGPTGIIGMTGATGASGATGATGTAGTDGIDGPTGNKGLINSVFVEDYTIHSIYRNTNTTVLSNFTDAIVPVIQGDITLNHTDSYVLITPCLPLADTGRRFGTVRLYRKIFSDATFTTEVSETEIGNFTGTLTSWGNSTASTIDPIYHTNTGIMNMGYLNKYAAMITYSCDVRDQPNSKFVRYVVKVHHTRYTASGDRFIRTCEHAFTHYVQWTGNQSRSLYDKQSMTLHIQELKI